MKRYLLCTGNLLAVTGVRCDGNKFDEDFACENAFDGITDAGYGKEWAAPDYQVVEMHGMFPQKVDIYKFILWSRCNNVEQTRKWTFTFSDNSTQ